ncbi:MAG: thioredoxin-disulfide reductase [Deltaproteobacteria bacterium]
MEEILYEVIIIGGGPAGLTASIYTARAGLATLVIEGATSVSQATTTDMIENYPGFHEGINGFELVDKFKQQALAFGTDIVSGDVVSITQGQCKGDNCWNVSTTSQNYSALSVICATGTAWRKLNVVGEEKFIGRGVSFCATCDGPLFRNKPVIVVGGGNAAIQEAIFLSKFASHVTVVHRRDKLRAANILQERAFKNEKITFAWSSVVEEIKGETTVQEVIIKNVITNQVSNISVNGVFVFIGLVPNTDIFRNILEVAQDGAIIADENMHTSADGIFACGDCISKLLRQVITACGDGAVAAYSAQHFVETMKGKEYPQR